MNPKRKSFLLWMQGWLLILIDLQQQQNLVVMEDWQDLLIQIIGWIYFFAWSFSFYGQIYENFKRKSVEGMNFDFIAMNLTGFTFYSIYNSYGYFISEDQTGKVDLNDLLFSYHAIIATLLTLSQIMIFPKQSNKIHTPTIIYLVVMWTFLAVWTLLTDGLKIIDVSVDARSVSLMGYCKLSISFLKYLPQFYWNYKRKSTVGWSIINIILDFTGGFFSFLQMGLQAIFGEDVNINPVKLILGIMVVIYDILFMIQHYVLYPESRKKKDEQTALQSEHSMQGSLIVPESKIQSQNQQ